MTWPGDGFGVAERTIWETDIGWQGARKALELSLIALSETPFIPEQGGVDYAPQKVQECLAWYGEHMLEQPKLDEVARAVNVSIRHLRRLFSQESGYTGSPGHRKHLYFNWPSTFCMPLAV